MSRKFKYFPFIELRKLYHLLTIVTNERKCGCVKVCETYKDYVPREVESWVLHRLLYLDWRAGQIQEPKFMDCISFVNPNTTKVWGGGVI